MESIFSGARKADRFDKLFGNKALADPSSQAEDLLWPDAPSRNKDTQPSHPSSYRLTLSPDSGLDFGRTRQEEDVIKAKEAELLRKAKQLEEEMMQVRQAKVSSVLRQFEQQLQRDAKLEHQRIKEGLEEQYV